MPDRVRVLVADDTPSFREGVVQSLSSESDIEFVSEAASKPPCSLSDAD